MFHIEDIPSPDDLPAVHGLPDWLSTVILLGGILAATAVIVLALAYPGRRRRER